MIEDFKNNLKLTLNNEKYHVELIIEISLKQLFEQMNELKNKVKIKGLLIIVNIILVLIIIINFFYILSLLIIRKIKRE